MPDRKAEYEASGHEITIQQNGSVPASAWIDGYAIDAETAFEYLPIETDGLDHWEKLERLTAFMADNDVYFCTDCETFYDCDDVTGTGFAGHKCGDCARSDAECPDNPNGDSHEDECVNPHQKHNARVPTKYQCVHCNRNRQTTPTG